MKSSPILLLIIIILTGCQQNKEHRKDISLNGTWEIAKTNSFSVIPDRYSSKIPVPGLVDLASPPIDSQDTAYANSVYWYKRTFRVDNSNAGVVLLKINKSAYHTRIYVNGKLAGDNTRSFTPTVINILPYLAKNGRENKLLIAVGCRNNLPDTVTNGWDFEKIKYTPGIYDDVKLIVSGYPFISNIQTAPDIKNGQLRVRAEIVTDHFRNNTSLTYIVRESVSGKVIAHGKTEAENKVKNLVHQLDFKINMPGAHLWSPEEPFLYDLELTTSGDNAGTRFGMRTFEADKDGKVFLLNGKPYYMRGTNVCILRFFEDANRAQLPWDSRWVVKLHSRFRDMHWNSMRYCIGFPPERWYEIADSIGFLIQDEFPVWTGVQGGFATYLKGINTRQLADEYRQWMRERWNHPSVVIWDAQNESVNDSTGKAISLVRSLDLSNRPWDNGFAAPVTDHDVVESHPYLFIRYMQKKPSPDGYLSELMSKPQAPRNDPNQWTPLPNGKVYPNPIIINEYGWLWLNRNGTTTTLTDQVYANVFPEATTAEKRREAYARNLGILTEYWRAHRQAAAVMHFCGLGYSRPENPRGQTSDNFIDIPDLNFEPQFYKYVKPAFSPVALMVDFWMNSLKPGQTVIIPVYMINDTYNSAEDVLTVSLYRFDELLLSRSFPYKLPGLGRQIINDTLTAPAVKGSYRLEATIVYKQETIKSIREFSVK
jgi:beta-galactosidase